MPPRIVVILVACIALVLLALAAQTETGRLLFGLLITGGNGS